MKSSQEKRKMRLDTGKKQSNKELLETDFRKRRYTNKREEVEINMKVKPCPLN